MRSDTVETFLAQLAGRAPTPGGGATAALHAAQAAALVAMVGRYSNTAKYAAHADRITDIVRDRRPAARATLCGWPKRTSTLSARSARPTSCPRTPPSRPPPGRSDRRRAGRRGPGARAT